MKLELLLAITFVFGVLRLLTHTKAFNVNLVGIFLAFIPTKSDTMFDQVLDLFGTWFFYFSLCFQAWYWLFRDIGFN